jgi:hypothetical protein
VSVQIACLLFYWFFCITSVEIGEFVILDTNLLLGIGFPNIFFQSVTLSFYSLNNVFHGGNIWNFDEVQLIDF